MKYKSFIFTIFAILLLIGFLTFYSKADKPVLLIVDLNKDGLTTIPLKDSNVMFDVDGDGYAERTEWVTPDDAILLIASRSKVETQQSALHYRYSQIFLANEKLYKSDRDKNGGYDRYDYDHAGDKSFPPINIALFSDRDSDGLPERLDPPYKCTNPTVDLAKRIINCDEQKYAFQIVPITFEDANVVWKKVCEKSSTIIHQNENDKKLCGIE